MPILIFFYVCSLSMSLVVACGPCKYSIYNYIYDCIMMNYIIYYNKYYLLLNNNLLWSFHCVTDHPKSTRREWPYKNNVENVDHTYWNGQLLCPSNKLCCVKLKGEFWRWQRLSLLLLNGPIPLWYCCMYFKIITLCHVFKQRIVSHLLCSSNIVHSLMVVTV